MKVSRGLLKTSLTKFIIYLIIVVAGIYFLEYHTWTIQGHTMEGTMLDSLMEAYPSDFGPLAWPMQLFQNYYKTVRPYVFWVMLFGVGLNIICLSISDSIPKFLAFFIGPIKFVTGGFITGLNIFFYAFWGVPDSKDDDRRSYKDYNNYNNNNPNSYNAPSQTPVDYRQGQGQVQTTVQSQSQDGRMTVGQGQSRGQETRRQFERHNVSSFTFISFLTLIFYAGIFFVANLYIIPNWGSDFGGKYHTLIVIGVNITVGILCIYYAFCYPNRKRVFKKCKNMVKKGMYIEEVKDIMKKFECEQFRNKYDVMCLSYRIQGSWIQSHGDYEEIIYFFDSNNELFDSSSGYKRTKEV